MPENQKKVTLEDFLRLLKRTHKRRRLTLMWGYLGFLRFHDAVEGRAICPIVYVWGGDNNDAPKTALAHGMSSETAHVIMAASDGGAPLAQATKLKLLEALCG